MVTLLVEVTSTWFSVVLSTVSTSSTTTTTGVVFWTAPYIGFVGFLDIARCDLHGADACRNDGGSVKRVGGGLYSDRRDYRRTGQLQCQLMLQKNLHQLNPTFPSPSND